MATRALTRLQIPVLSQRGRWLISFRGKRAEFADRDAAVAEAISQAFQCGKDGAPCEVVLVAGDRKREVVWAYGVDPDPPGHGRGKRGLGEKPAGAVRSVAPVARKKTRSAKARASVGA